MHPTIKNYVAPQIAEATEIKFNENLNNFGIRILSMAINLLPEKTPGTIFECVKNAFATEIDGFITKLKKSREDYYAEAIDGFCKDNNICPTCIVGGYDCGSDHK